MSDELSPTATDVQPSGQGDLTATQSEVQPTQGQGQEDSSTGLYDLSSIEDPEIRSHVERIAKDIDRNTQAKFEEAANFRKEWQPYDELGIKDLGPENVGALVELAQMLSNEETAQDAVTALAEQVGLSLGQSQEDEGEPDPNAQLLARLEAIEARDSERQQKDATASELNRLQSEWEEVETAHGRKFDEGETTLLADLARRFDSEDEPIKAAYALFNQIAGYAEKNLVKAKTTEPPAAETGGSASTAATPPETFEEAQQAFIKRRAHLHVA